MIVLPFCHSESFLNICFKNRQLLKQYVLFFFLEFELAFINIFQESGALNSGNCRDTLFVLQKINPTKEASRCAKKVHAIVWNSGYMGYSEILSIRSANVKGEKFAKTTETGKSVGNLMNKEVGT